MFPETLFFAAPGDLAATILAAVFGLLIGSFLNVVIYRLPKMMQRDNDNYVAHESGKELPYQDTFNLMVPRSACPHCGHQITALENIPVISYLALRGKCSACKAPIPVRYPAIEAVTAVISAALIWHFGSGWAGIATLGFAYALIAMTCIDYDTQLLPDDLTQPLLWAGLLLNINATFVPLQDAVIGAAAGYLVLWAVYWLFKLVTGKEGMGYGDFKLLAALGAWMGWKALPSIILISSVVGALVGIFLIVVAKRAREHAIPFGPYLAAAGMIAMLWSAPIAALSQRYFG